ncbi:MAG: hypothetical protein RL329_2833, partial [Bacteroidota bacterium]
LVSNNQLTGSIPNFNLPSLNRLHLTSNQLTGCIPTAIKTNCPRIGVLGGQISNNPNLATQSWANYWVNGEGACSTTTTTQESITASQCGDRQYRLPSGRTVNAAGTYQDTVRATGATTFTAYTVNLVADQTCHCQDSIGLAGMYHSGGGVLPWDLRQPIATFAGVTLNAQGCMIAFRNPRPMLDSCVQLQGNYALVSDFAFFNTLRDSIPNMWSRNGIDLYETPVLSISQLRREDTAIYSSRMTFPQGRISLFPNLTSVQSRPIRLKFCCNPVRDTVQKTICAGECMDWRGLRVCTAGTFATPERCDSVHTLLVRTVPNNIQLSLTQIGSTLCAAGGVNPESLRYQWSTGPTNRCIPVGTGSYSVTVTNANGCRRDTTVNISIQSVDIYVADTAFTNCGQSIICQTITRTSANPTVTAVLLKIPFDANLLIPNGYTLGSGIRNIGEVIDTVVNGQRNLTILTRTNWNANTNDVLITLCWNIKPVALLPDRKFDLPVFVEESAITTRLWDTIPSVLKIRDSKIIQLALWADMAHRMPRTNNMTYVTYRTTTGIRRDSSLTDALILKDIVDPVIQLERHSLPDLTQKVIVPFDAYEINRYLNNAIQRTPEQVLRMDADGDGAITGQDVTWVMRRSVYLFPTEFPQVLRNGALKSWGFMLKDRVNSLRLSPSSVPVEQTITLPNLAAATCDTSVVPILSYLLGDNDLTFATSGNLRLGRASLAKVALCNATPLGNNLYNISVWANTTVRGLNIRILEHSTAMEVVDVTNADARLNLWVNIDSLNRCFIGGITSDANGIESNKRLCNIIVRKLNTPIASDFRHIMAVIDSDVAETEVLLPACTNAVEQTITEAHLEVYPNPTTGDLKVRSDKTLGTITVYNTLGQLVQKVETVDTEKVIDLNALPTGFYFVKVREQTVKIFKE